MRIAVASRWPQRLSLAASINRSISRSVRYSRGRPDRTVTFTWRVGANLHTGRVDDKPTLASQGIDKNLANQARIWAVRMALIAATIIVLAEGGMAATITVHAPDGEGRVFVDVVGTINDEDFKTFKEKTDQIYPIGAGHPRSK
jgi:hypothetical protein